MAKPLFPGEKVSRFALGARSYLDPSAFSPTPKKEKDRFKIPYFVIYTIASLTILAGIIWLIFLSPFFSVKDISIEGDAGEETQAAIMTLAGKNIFLIGGAKAERKIVSLQPGIKSIKIIRGLPRTIIVLLVERDPALVWESQGKKYLVDQDGVPYKEGDNARYPLVVDGKNLPVELGKPLVSPAFVVYARRLYLDLPQMTNLEIARVLVPESTFLIEVETKNSYRLKFDTSRDEMDQIEDIKYILEHYKDQVKEQIDVRIEGYGYIK